jgi:hypothetical protein
MVSCPLLPACVWCRLPSLSLPTINARELSPLSYGSPFGLSRPVFTVVLCSVALSLVAAAGLASLLRSPFFLCDPLFARVRTPTESVVLHCRTFLSHPHGFTFPDISSACSPALLLFRSFRRMVARGLVVLSAVLLAALIAAAVAVAGAGAGDWEAIWDSTQKRHYYWRAATQTVTWDKPSDFVDPPAPTAATGPATGAAAAPPAQVGRWQRLIDAQTHQPYYYHLDTSTYARVCVLVSLMTLRIRRVVFGSRFLFACPCRGHHLGCTGGVQW